MTIPEETNPWRQAVDAALVSAGLDCLAPDADPAGAIRRLLEWRETMALDPAISERAQALIERGQASAPQVVEPIPMLLYCPKCGTQHVDGYEYNSDRQDRYPAFGEDPAISWDNPPHRSHLCHRCGCIWRPADVPTTGVKTIATKGKADNWEASAPSVQVVEPTEPVAWYRTYYDQRMGISWDRVQPTLPGWGEHPLYDAPQASAPSVQVVPLTNDQLDAASTSEGGNLDLRRSFRAGALWAEEHYRAALAQASALPAAQQPAVEPPNRAFALLLLSEASKSGHAGTIKLAAQLAGVPSCEGCGYVVQHCRCASPTAQPAALSLHERYWLDIRERVIDALAAKGLQIVTTAHGVHLMPLGNATAQPVAPDVVADARRQPIETAPEDGQCLVWCATDDGGEVMKLPRDKMGFWLYDSEPTFSAPFYIEPTHWMPLPPPPAIDAELDREGQRP